MRKPDSSLKLPEKFRKQYRKNIIIRTTGSLVLLAIAAVLCCVIDFSATRYPEMGMILIVGAAFVLSCLIFRFQLILFKPSWVGIVREIVAKKERRMKVQASTNLRNRIIVHLYIDRGEAELYDHELWHEGMEHSGVRTEDGASESLPENKFLTEAPYKVDDTLIYLRGMRYPFRYGVLTEGMFDVRFVCPFCGEINKSERETCYHCNRTLVK